MCSPRLDELLTKLDDVLTSITTEILGIDPEPEPDRAGQRACDAGAAR